MKIFIIALSLLAFSLFTMQEPEFTREHAWQIQHYFNSKLSTKNGQYMPDNVTLLQFCKDFKDNNKNLIPLLQSKNSTDKMLDYIQINAEAKKYYMPKLLVALFLNTEGTYQWLREKMYYTRNLRITFGEILIDVARDFNKTDDCNLTKALFRLGVDPNFKTSLASAFINACTYGNVHLVNTYLDAGADIETQAPVDKYTPIMEAAFDGHQEIVESLIKRKANVHANVFNETSLDLAVQNKHENIVKLLRQAGARPRQKTCAENN